jgi:hypothetical protein
MLTPGGLERESRRAASETTDDEAERSALSSSADGSLGVTFDVVDPMTRALSLPGLRMMTPTAASLASPASREAPLVAASQLSLEHVMTRLVRRIAWSGDAQSGTARLELGAGELEGATLLIRSDRGALDVSLELPPGADRAEWKERIAKRLDARGLQISSLEVA